ncbi:phosphatidylglycerol lysyltransferase domain-containing protein [Robertmurraya korlensis]|uniref:phosphatidylglycerol lysyltransferase domain-containing protein n=1 Tax=Robertmurraya korlensis TaxID=519977 RepID=UPI000826E3C8|nr:phosphatidylglycerol lysyltransferase domain-containing protein [Robertmurraya korlensis]
MTNTMFSLSKTEHKDEQVLSFLQENGGNHASHLILLRDKELFWAVQQKVLIAYKKIANKLVVLGDPIGNEVYMSDAIKEFHEYCDQLGLTPVFYQISARFMHVYHETGFSFMKLGEEGIVNVKNFSLAGKQGAKLRTKFNKFARENFHFRVVSPPYSHSLLTELRAISDEWLGDQKEKGFSVVSFSEEYVSSFPVALLTNTEGQVVAFATLPTDYKDTVTIDLMRKTTSSSYGTMDVLFIHIFQWVKEHGYEYCSLGMAPLANVGKSKYSITCEKLIRYIFLHGNALYKFKGLQEFKGKFTSSWEPKYLAYKKSPLLLVIIQLILLINQPPLSTKTNKVVRKLKYLIKKAV